MSAKIHLTLFCLSLWFSACGPSRSLEAPDLPIPILGEENNNHRDLGEQSSLEDLLAIAALNNPGLKGAYYQWQAAMSRIAQARALPDPRISYAYFIRQVETRVGPQRQKIGVAQTFPWFGKLSLKGSAMEKAALAAQARFEAKKQALFFEVKSAYLEYAYVHQAAEILEENVALLSNIENVVSSTYQTGKTAYANLIKIQVELDKLNDRLIDLREMRRPLQARLNASLNRPPQAFLPQPQAPQASHFNEMDSLWHRQMIEHNPDLAAAGFLIENKAAGVKLARKQFLPDFTLGVDFIDTGEALNPESEESGKDPLVAMLSINLPLWFGKNKAAVDEAKAQYAAAKQERQAGENRLHASLEMTLFQAREAKRKIDLYRDTLIPRSQQALEVTRSAFESGETGFVEMVDLQRTLLAFNLTLARETVNLNKSLAELEMLTGKELPKGVSNHE